MDRVAWGRYCADLEADITKRTTKAHRVRPNQSARHQDFWHQRPDPEGALRVDGAGILLSDTRRALTRARVSLRAT